MTQPSPSKPQGLSVRLHSERPVPLQAQFECAPGELLALVGASGSGKTTLLRAIAGLHQGRDVHGVITLGDQAWLDSSRGLARSPQSRRVGMVFQQYALFPHLSAIENIAISADFLSASGLKEWKNGLQAPVLASSKVEPAASDAQQLAMHWLQRFGMQELAHRLPHELSGGQQQRVALARAVVRVMGGAQSEQAGGEAGVLLLDEPFSAVDVPMRQVLYTELEQLRKSLQVPIILVTHDLQEARRLADRMVILDGGDTLQSGSPEQLLRRPRNARVARLMGIANHFQARYVRSSTGQAQLHWGDVRLPAIGGDSSIADGSPVNWVLAGEAVRLMTQDMAQMVAKDEPISSDEVLVQAQLTQLWPLGEISLCRLAVVGTSDRIELHVSTHELHKMGAQLGSSLSLAIAAQGVHILPV